MGLLSQLSKKNRIVSIVGMAKNAGKTTALNYLIEEAMDEGMVLGITSTGRDGETTDLVTGTEKPKVYLYQDTLVSVPKDLYELAEAGLEILRMTEYPSTLGQILICKVVESGYVQIAGPVTTKDQKKICKDMMKMGANMVIIDGAIDRKSIANPDASDAIIISTGAVISRDMKKVVRETAHVIELYETEVLKDENIKKVIYENQELDRILILSDQDIKVLDLTTGLGASEHIDKEISENTKYLYIPGAFTKSVIGAIPIKKLKNIEVILKDPTKIFIDSTTWGQLRKKGLKVKVLENIKVAAVTVNPFAPSGYFFENQLLLEEMAKAVPHIPVIDVRV